MTPQQIKLVQQSFAQVKPIADMAAKLFYDRLFEDSTRSSAAFSRRHGGTGRES